MSLFLDQLWVWIGLTFLVGSGGFAWYCSNPTGRKLAVAVLLPICTFVLGLTLYYGVETDQKSITRTLDALVVAIEKDDLHAVCQLISPKAEETLQLARSHMGLILVPKAKYRDLQIDVNDATSPPTAKIRFSATVYWKTKAPIEGFVIDNPVPQNVRFDEVELVKTKDRTWLVTDKCRYYLPNFP